MHRAPQRHPAHRFFLGGLIFLYVAALVVSHIPAERMPDLRVSDRKLHFAGFLGLAFATMLTLSAYGVSRRKALTACLVIVSLYGAMDEVTQPLFNRYCALEDYAADILGSLAAVVLFELARWYRRRGRGVA